VPEGETLADAAATAISPAVSRAMSRFQNRLHAGGGPGVAPMRGPWRLAQLDAAPRLGLRAVSTFSGGGGSSMGYRLAGIDVVAAVEIDPQMADRYEANLGAGKVVRAPVGDVAKWTDAELAGKFGRVDILDGSPPCSTFSMAGRREDKWGSEHRFREGQAVQRLDALFMDFVALAGGLRPRVVIGENVKGMMLGAARGFLLEVRDAFDAIGYDTQLFLLDASRMGVPQRRERVFFMARRRDLGLSPISLSFDEPWITTTEAVDGLPPQSNPYALSRLQLDRWLLTRPGRSLSEADSRGYYFNWIRCAPDRPFPTITAFKLAPQLHWSEPRRLSAGEVVRAQTFPDDYAFDPLPAQYVCGMSVPPQMARRIGLAVAAWLGATPAEG